VDELGENPWRVILLFLFAEETTFAQACDVYVCVCVCVREWKIARSPTALGENGSKTVALRGDRYTRREEHADVMKGRSIDRVLSRVLLRSPGVLSERGHPSGRGEMYYTPGSGGKYRFVLSFAAPRRL